MRIPVPSLSGKVSRALDFAARLALPLSYFLVEIFALNFLSPGETLYSMPPFFGILWAVILTGILQFFPRKLSAAAYGITYFLALAYAIVQTGYYLLFSEMMWISDFRYASEGSDYFDILLSYPPVWWLGMGGMVLLGIFVLWRYPAPQAGWIPKAIAAVLVIAACVGTVHLPPVTFKTDQELQYARSDYGRAKSAQAAYENMFNTHRLYQICGLYQTALKDIYTNTIYPITPGYLIAQEEAREEISAYFDSQTPVSGNEMTGLIRDKNVILVLMESMDDWMIGEHTPTIGKMMSEGIRFTNFYTPGYGGIRTFNTEFCINTGSFLSSQGGYAFDYVTNTFDQSLANQLAQIGYSPKVFHYNDPSFYSRGVFSEAMGYDEYVFYGDYVSGEEAKNLLYDDNLLFDNQGLSDRFFREGKTLNFVITRSAHLSYKYNEVLSHWALKKYPEYRGLTGSEETDCAYLKARLVDDFFARMLEALEEQGQLENTVIVAVTDHYTYGYKNTPALLELSGVKDNLLLEKTPCFIWGAGVPAMEVDKLLNTSDLLPTLLNLLDVDSEYDYIGSDAFDPNYDGFVPFSDGSWIRGDVGYNASTDVLLSISGQTSSITVQFRDDIVARVQEFVRINNRILETDYYLEPEEE